MQFVSSEKRAGRRGVLSMELVLTLPILGMLLFGIFEFSLLFYARGLVVEASRAGARKASLAGCCQQDVEREVARVLTRSLHQGTRVRCGLGERTGDVVWVSVEVPMGNAAPNLLWPIGVGLGGQNIYSETRMVRE